MAAISGPLTTIQYRVFTCIKNTRKNIPACQKYITWTFVLLSCLLDLNVDNLRVGYPGSSCPEGETKHQKLQDNSDSFLSWNGTMELEQYDT